MSSLIKEKRILNRLTMIYDQNMSKMRDLGKIKLKRIIEEVNLNCSKSQKQEEDMAFIGLMALIILSKLEIDNLKILIYCDKKDEKSLDSDM